MRAAEEASVVTLGVGDEATLKRMKSAFAAHLDRFAFREASAGVRLEPAL